MTYPYEVLKYIDTLNIEIIYVNLIVLDMNDMPIKEINGQTTGGNLSFSKSSAIRRTGSLTMLTALEDDLNPLGYDIINKITEIDNLISVNKRVSVQLGIKNNGGQFQEKYDIFWFNMGDYIITSASISSNNSGISISLKLSDKMVLLNGEVNGKLQMPITHSPVYSEITEKEEPVKYIDLIKTLVCDFCKIPESKILISDIPTEIKNYVTWTSNDPLFIQYSKDADNKKTAISKMTTIPPKIRGTWDVFYYGDVIGMRTVPYTYSGELTSQAGDSVVTVLDKIKNQLGNYEYFFDEFGNFIFREIKDYLNQGSAYDDLADAINDKYLQNLVSGKSMYSFQGYNISYSNSPQYNKIKNDFSIWGKRASDSMGIRYHLIIDTPPAIGTTYYVTTKTDDFGVIRVKDIKLESTLGYIEVTTSDWRQELYFQACLKANNLTPLEKEIKEEIPKIMTNWWTNDEVAYIYNDQLEDLSYWIDMLDPKQVNDKSVYNLSVESIGRRPVSLKEEGLNCLLTKTPNTFIIPPQSAVLEDYFLTGLAYNAAFNYVRMVLHEYLSYNNSISVTTKPIYYLEPNTRVTVEDDASDIHGDYIINSISIPLTVSGTMTINASRATERI